jgi:hypothetical protein
MAVAPALQVKIPMASVVASNPNPSMEESVIRLTWIWLWVRTQKPRPEGDQNPAEGGGGHVGGALAVGDPPHGIEGS